ncbi:uncharacterized protein MONBRDRAFT_24634, partial [Monosiga brevicollis MX1]
MRVAEFDKSTWDLDKRPASNKLGREAGYAREGAEQRHTESLNLSSSLSLSLSASLSLVLSPYLCSLSLCSLSLLSLSALSLCSLSALSLLSLSALSLLSLCSLSALSLLSLCSLSALSLLSLSVLSLCALSVSCRTLPPPPPIPSFYYPAIRSVSHDHVDSRAFLQQQHAILRHHHLMHGLARYSAQGSRVWIKTSERWCPATAASNDGTNTVFEGDDGQ